MAHLHQWQGHPGKGVKHGQVIEAVKGSALPCGSETRLEFLEQAGEVQGWIHARQGLDIKPAVVGTWSRAPTTWAAGTLFLGLATTHES